MKKNKRNISRTNISVDVCLTRKPNSIVFLHFRKFAWNNIDTSTKFDWHSSKSKQRDDTFSWNTKKNNKNIQRCHSIVYIFEHTENSAVSIGLDFSLSIFFSLDNQMQRSEVKQRKNYFVVFCLYLNPNLHI